MLHFLRILSLKLFINENDIATIWNYFFLWKIVSVCCFFLRSNDQVLYSSMVVIKLTFLSRFIDSPAMVQLYIIKFVLTEEFNGLFEVDHSFDEEANICLLFNFISTLIHAAVEGETLPIFSRPVKESGDAVKQVDREPKNMEFVTIELRILLVIVDKKFTSDFKLECILVESPQAIE